MNGIDKDTDMIRIVVGMETVAEVGNVWAISKATQHRSDLSLDRFGVAVEGTGIEIALQTNGAML